MQEYKKQHMDMVQNIMTRMANNSFLIKGWSISLISAILIFANKDNNSSYILITFLPALSFWVLDSYYLQLERKFRELYRDVQLDYVNNTSNVDLFSMNINKYKVASIPEIMFSLPIVPIHLVILVTIIAITTITFKCKLLALI